MESLNNDGVQAVNTTLGNDCAAVRATCCKRGGDVPCVDAWNVFQWHK